MDRGRSVFRQSRIRRGRTAGDVVAGLVLLLCVPPVAAEPVTALTWRHDPDLAVLPPPVAGRPQLLYFTAAWCGPCKLLEREVFDHPDGVVELQRYDLVRLDLDSPAGRREADGRGVQSVPTFIMLAADGSEIERIGGYRSRRLLLRDLARFREGRGTFADLQRRLEVRPDDQDLKLELGLRHHDRRETDAARTLLAEGLRVLPDGGDRTAASDSIAAAASRALAGIHRQDGAAALAAGILERLLTDRPDHPQSRVTWRLLADCRAEAGDADGAIAALHMAAMIQPPRAEHLTEFALAAGRRGRGDDLERAEEAARQAVDLTGRTDAASMAALAQVLRHRRRYPEAMLWIKRAEAADAQGKRWGELRRAILEAAVLGR
jgi:tetratricopeptide (TPR) repeat protein